MPRPISFAYNSAGIKLHPKGKNRNIKKVGIAVQNQPKFQPDSDDSSSESSDSSSAFGSSPTKNQNSKHHTQQDDIYLSSAKAMREVKKLTDNIVSAQNALDSGSDDDANFGSTKNEAAESAAINQDATDDEGILAMLNDELEFDVMFDEDGAVIEDPKSKIAAERKAAEALKNKGRLSLSNSLTSSKSTLDNDNNFNNFNDSDSGSDLEFGDAGFGADGVPYEKYKNLEDKLAALVGKMKAQKKDFKDYKKNSKKEKTELAQFKTEVEILRSDVEELDSKLIDAYRNQTHNNNSTALGGGVSTSAAVEEARRKLREDARKALFSAGDDGDDENYHTNLEDISWIAGLYLKLGKWVNKQMPLSGDIRTIQGHFGSSVASFFNFYRWIIITNIYASTGCLIYLVIHLYSLVFYPIPNYDPWGLQVLLPNFMAVSSYRVSARYQFLSLVVFIIGALFTDAIRKWIIEDKNSKLIDSIESETANVKFAKQFLCCWDCGVVKATDAEDLQCAIGSTMITMLAVENETGKTLDRTRNENIALGLRKFVGIVLYTALLVAGWLTIIYLTTQSNQLATYLEGLIYGGSYVSGSIVPACVSIINSIFPALIEKLTSLEKWDSEKQIVKVLLIKMYLAKILNVLIQFFSYFLLADPFVFTSSSSEYFGYDFSTISDTVQYQSIRTNVEIAFQPEVYTCRLDQVAAGLVQLLTVDFFVSKAIAMIMPYANKLKSALLRQKDSKTEFLVANKMVDLLYFQGLVFLSIPFSPLFTIFILLFHVLTFKFEKVMLFKFGTKPKKEWKAQDAGGFFIKFYLITIIVTGMVSVVLFLTSTTFAKDISMLEEELEVCSASVVSPSCTTVNSTQILTESRFKCGPFVEATSAWVMVTEDVTDASAFTQMSYQIFVNVLIVWFITLFFYLKYRFTESSLGVNISSMQERGVAFESANAANEAKIRKLTKQVQKLELAAQI